jgi:hypothetical protein
VIRRVLLLLAMAGIYVAIKRSLQPQEPGPKDQFAEAQWANEGGANAPTTV